jgi:hypothetical protein
MPLWVLPTAYCGISFLAVYCPGKFLLNRENEKQTRRVIIGHAFGVGIAIVLFLLFLSEPFADPQVKASSHSFRPSYRVVDKQYGTEFNTYIGGDYPAIEVSRMRGHDRMIFKRIAAYDDVVCGELKENSYYEQDDSGSWAKLKVSCQPEYFKTEEELRAALANDSKQDIRFSNGTDFLLSLPSCPTAFEASVMMMPLTVMLAGFVFVPFAIVGAVSSLLVPLRWTNRLVQILIDASVGE